MRRSVKEVRIAFDKVIVVEGGWEALVDTGLLGKLMDRGCVPLLCCGEGRIQLIAAYHPGRVAIGDTIRCPRCQIVHTFRELSEPSKYLEGATRAFVRPDGTIAEGL